MSDDIHAAVAGRQSSQETDASQRDFVTVEELRNQTGRDGDSQDSFWNDTQYDYFANEWHGPPNHTYMLTPGRRPDQSESSYWRAMEEEASATCATWAWTQHYIRRFREWEASGGPT